MPSWVLAAASGVTIAAAFPMAFPFLGSGELDPQGHLECLAWLGLVPLLAAVDRAPSSWRAGGSGLLAGSIFGLVLTYWLPGGMMAFGFRSLLFCFGLWLAVPGLVIGLHWALATTIGFVVRRKLGWPYWTHLPFTWAATEFLRNFVLNGFAWGNLGYSQARHGAVSQLAALGGTYAVAAFVVFVAAVLFESWQATVRRKLLPLRTVSVAAGVIGVVLVGGCVRQAKLRYETEHASTIRVAAVQPNLSQARKSVATADVLNRLLPLTVEADRRGAQLVVWPETTFPGPLPVFLETFTDVPGWPEEPLHQAHVLIGAMTFSAAANERRQLEFRNGEYLLSPTHQVLGRYAKRRLVPFAEYGVIRAGAKKPPDVASGTDTETLKLRLKDGARVPFGTLICSDAFDSDLTAAQARNRFEFVVVITNEAWAGRTSLPYQAQAIAQLRAVETGKAFVRASYTGPTAVLLPTGEVLSGAIGVSAEPDGEDLGSSLLIADVPRLGNVAVYTQIGNVFAWMAVAFTCALTLASLHEPRPCVRVASPGRAPS